MDTGFNSPRMVNDSRNRVFLFRPAKKEERPVDDIFEHGDCRRRCVPGKCKLSCALLLTVHNQIQRDSGSFGDSLSRSVIPEVDLLETSVSVVSQTSCFHCVIYVPHVDYFALAGVLEKPSIGSARVPSIVFCVFQLMFASLTYVHSYHPVSIN